MIAFAEIKNRIRTYLYAHTFATEENLAYAGKTLAPPDGIWYRETFSEFTVDYPAQFSCRISGSVIYEIMIPADSDFSDAETIQEQICEIFLPPLMLSGNEFRIQTTRITPLAPTHERAWNIAAARIHFFVFPA